MANRIIRGASVTIDETEYNLPNVIGEVQLSMDEDPEDDDILSREIILTYAHLTGDPQDITTPRGAYNKALIDVCGFSIRTLLMEAEAESALLETLGFDPPGDVEVDDDSDLDDAP